MTGLEKITDKINSDSNIRCSEIAALAQKQSEKADADAKEKGEKLASEIEEAAKEECDNIIRIAKSGAVQQSRQTLLSARVEAVNETLAGLVTALKSLDNDKYFATVIKLAVENAMKGKCTAFLNAKDNARLPASFGADLVSALAAKGAECVLSSDNADIGSGVILDYGNIVIDCSFEAIVEENSDYYKEKISEIIF